MSLLLSVLLLSACKEQLSVTLHSGDRITGCVMQQDSHQITLNTSYAGAVRINTDAIASRQLVPFTKTQTTGQALPTSASLPKMLATQLTIDLAASSRMGQQHADSLNISSKGIWQPDRWRYQLAGQFDYQTKAGAQKTHKYQLNSGIDYFYRDHYFWRLAVDYQYDYLASDYKNIDIAIGPGVKLWQHSQDRFELSLLFGRKKAYFREDDLLKALFALDNSVSFHIGMLKWDYQQKFWQHVEVFNQGSYLQLLNQPLAFIDFKREYSTEAGVRYWLSEQIRLSWSWQYARSELSLVLPEHDEISLNINDLQYKLSIGARF